MPQYYLFVLMNPRAFVAYSYIVVLISCCFSLQGQDYLQGYSLSQDSVTFVFDPQIYGHQPDRVVVTGAFRSWSQDMDDPEWSLAKEDQLWKLKIANKDYSIINPQTPFKYRIDDGSWLEPPNQATNIKGGNLIFMPDIQVAELRAEIRTDHLIWANVSIDRPLNKSDYILKDAQGNKIDISAILPQDATNTMIYTQDPIDIKRVYYLSIPKMGLTAHCSFDGWFRERYSHKTLGANVVDGKTSIRIFAPRATSVQLHFYKDRTSSEPSVSHMMQEDDQGVWEVLIEEDLHGTYYDFSIYGYNEVGNHYYDTIDQTVNDPYARVSDDTWGRCRIWRNTRPATPLKNGIPKMEDVIAYEVHVQDFTDQLPVSEDIRGTFTAMTMQGLTNERGEKIGFDYLIDLGINVVHLMPVQEYLHFPTDDWKASFADDPYMLEQGISEENYQWGYRTTFAMAVESRYRTKNTEPGTERVEFRDLVQAFHDKDIAVIIDIVPNHTGENMDGNEWFFNFNGIDQQYYYRTKDFKHIGAYGNEVKTENRPMVQRWLIDQCKYFIEEFGVDGFRIDLAGQIDRQTLKALKVALGDDIIIYGEAWIGSNDPDFENNPDWDWYKDNAPITFFQDDTRNAFKGPVFELKDYQLDRGWPGGNFKLRDKVMLGLSNSFGDDKTPLSGISYLDIHDNFALADQFGGPQFDGRQQVDQAAYKIAVTLLYTTLGPIVTHGGSEIMRSKAHAPLQEVIKETNAGYKLYMHGYRDTYNHRKANQFIWQQVGQRPTEDNHNDYKNMLDFWKGMNQFRKSDYGEVFRVSESPDQYYQWILPESMSALGYVVDDRILVLLNAGKEDHVFTDIMLTEGTWRRIATIDEVSLHEEMAVMYPWINSDANQTHELMISAESLGIWVKEK